MPECKALGDWLCPVCRDICNCSAETCLRKRRGWFSTGELIHEARGRKLDPALRFHSVRGQCRICSSQTLPRS